MSEIKQVTDWIEAAQQQPSVRNAANYLAYTMSELAECLEEIPLNPIISMLAEEMQRVSDAIRSGRYDYCIAKADRTGLMDGAADTAWTAIGLMHMLGDAQVAFNEVVRSNYSKFEGGVCELDATGKVVKGPSYFKPDLAKYLR